MFFSVRTCSFLVGNGAIQTTLEATPCLHQSTGSRSVIWEHYYPKSLENLQRASGEDLEIKLMDDRLLPCEAAFQKPILTVSVSIWCLALGGNHSDCKLCWSQV